MPKTHFFLYLSNLTFPFSYFVLNPELEGYQTATFSWEISASFLWGGRFSLRKLKPHMSHGPIRGVDLHGCKVLHENGTCNCHACRRCFLRLIALVAYGWCCRTVSLRHTLVVSKVRGLDPNCCTHRCDVHTNIYRIYYRFARFSPVSTPKDRCDKGGR